jgi:hypothetical protein
MLRRCHLVAIAALVVLASLWSQRAAADPPDILRSYRFIPSRSRVVQTGGIAGFVLPFTVRGRFDLVTGYEYGPGPSLMPYAAFENVDAWMIPHSPLAYVLSLDRTFNMTGLDGTFADPNRLHFSGENDQGAAVRLTATLHGRLLHLAGATDPPCCDFFQYQINALAYLTPYGDFNFDGRVDTADFTVWRDTMGSTSDLEADGNGDGVVDHADYLIWKSDAGTSIDLSMFDGFDGLTAAGVPEPSTFLLVSIAGGVTMLVTSSLRATKRDRSPSRQIRPVL